MRFAGNVIWFVLNGAVLAIFWLIGAAIFALSIIGLPLARAAIEMAKLSAWPFGREVVHIRELDDRGLDATTALTGTIGFIANVLWACTFGALLFVGYLVSGVFYCITLIGIPLGLQAFKLAGLSLWPVGRRVVTLELAQAARERNAEAQLNRYRARSEDDGEEDEDERVEADEPRLELPPPRRAPAGDVALLERPLPPAAPSPVARAIPPQLANDRGWFIEVVGEASYQDALRRAAETATSRYDGKPLVMATLEPEDDNPHDIRAVRVDLRRRPVGYLPRELAREYRATMGARRSSCSGLLYGGEGVDEDGDPRLYGIWLNAAWPPRFK